MVRQLPDESDRIREKNLPVLPQIHRPGGRVERREQTILHEHFRARQRAHQGGFPRVGVPHERDLERVASSPTPYLPLLRDLLQSSREIRDSLPHLSAVYLQLGLAGASRADPRPPGPDSAGLSGQVGPLSGQSRHQVFELCEFHLCLRLPGPSPAREDVQNQAAAIQDPRLDDAFQIAHLRRRKIVVEDRQIDLLGLDRRADLLCLPPADEERRIHGRSFLNDPVHHRGPGRIRQQREFVERYLHLPPPMRREDDAHDHRAFGVGRTYDAIFGNVRILL